MKRQQIIFWTTTGLFAFFMLFSAYNYFTSQDFKAAFLQLGFPDYFRIELAVAKIIGVLALVLPFVPKPIKVFAYVGFTIVLISALIAHIAIGDSVSTWFVVLFALALVGVSYFSYTKLQPQSVK